MNKKYQFNVGDKVEWTNEYGSYRGVKTIVGLGELSGEPAYYIEPHDAPWFTIKEQYLTQFNGESK